MENRGYLLMSAKELERIACFEKIKAKVLTQTKASKQLKLSRRQVNRLYQRYLKYGAAGIISKRRGAPSNNRLKQQTKDQALALIKANYHDFGPTLAHEKLTEKHQLKLSVESVRQIMMKEGLWKGKKRSQARVHPMRQRRAQYGELVQIDGSPHAWFEDRAEPCTLLVFVDDATGKIMQLHFEEQESCYGYMDALRGYLMQHGCPLNLYSDKHGIFRVNIKQARGGTGETQFSRALRELGIGLVHANTPQAKGRVERMNATLQDRLVKELRLRGISTIEQANAFLLEFIEDFNKRFAVKAASGKDAHRQVIPSEGQLEQILCKRCTRVISKNLEVHYQNKIYQIKTEDMGYTLRGAKVSVNDYKGKVSLVYKHKQLDYTVMELAKRINPVVDSKSLDTHMRKQSQWKPPSNHPWKRTAKVNRPDARN